MTSRIHVAVPIRFADLDAFGHVNNVALLTVLEEARISVFWGGDLRVDGIGGSGDGVTDVATATTISLVGRQEIEYLAPVPYLRDPLDVHVWIGRLGGASLDVCYEIWSPVGATPSTRFALAMTTLVLVDAASGRPRRITDRERAAWTAHLDVPVAFARRT